VAISIGDVWTKRQGVCANTGWLEFDFESIGESVTLTPQEVRNFVFRAFGAGTVTIAKPKIGSFAWRCVLTT
jgi:hypothetical protein